MKKNKTVSSVLFLGLSMMLAVAVFSSWLRCQEGYRDEKGRWCLRYTQRESLWKKVDYNAFLKLNGTMKNNAVMQTIWGITNHRAFDLAAAAWMVLLFGCYYVRNPRGEDRVAIMQFGLYMTASLLLVAIISEASIQFHRLSPGEIGELKNKAIILSDLTDRITWKVKVGSSNSFPGDHAMVLMFIGSFIIYRLRSWYGAAAGFGIVAFILPRLAGGGHWLSDVLVGGLFFYLILFPLLMFAPLREWALVRLRNPAVWLSKKLSFIVPDGWGVQITRF